MFSTVNDCLEWFATDLHCIRMTVLTVLSFTYTPTHYELVGTDVLGALGKHRGAPGRELGNTVLVCSPHLFCFRMFPLSQCSWMFWLICTVLGWSLPFTWSENAQYLIHTGLEDPLNHMITACVQKCSPHSFCCEMVSCIYTILEISPPRSQCSRKFCSLLTL